ncbi:hypothetical protein FNV43_RR20311 [Rhamnella rubrinervis]|uniref:Uncharacterized protein n=1 Tax=Rhamnella rubrinervis TaxID=2594499 RepID=A0A8K0DVQ0_9ROSA|nr:hypothetical protein FNV43_RR20311 [Rhamnella rubrinervis]
MITGLNCDKFPHDSELDHLPYDLWTKFFGKRGPMTQGKFNPFALSAFIDDDPSTRDTPRDYNALEKSSFQLILTSGSWLGNGCRHFYIRRRMINSFQMSDRIIVTAACSGICAVNNDNKHWLVAKVDIERTVTLSTQQYHESRFIPIARMTSACRCYFHTSLWSMDTMTFIRTKD